MDTRLVVGLVAGVLLLGVLYYEHESESGGGALPAEYTVGPEALKWLRSSVNESALASNRFGETENAVRFVKQLYAAGATRVIVPQESITDDDVEVYADALVVTLPMDEAKRERVWKLCAAEIERETGESAGSPEGSHVFLWWD
jgi:hypothetical protein